MIAGCSVHIRFAFLAVLHLRVKTRAGDKTGGRGYISVRSGAYAQEENSKGFIW